MSEVYLKLRASADGALTEEYFRLHRETEASRAHETKAVTEIQRRWRGYIARKYVAFLHANATEIKRTWRGYHGRLKAEDRRRRRDVTAEGRFYDYMATLIQKMFRGHYSRLRKQDFYARKRYVQHVTLNSKKLSQTIRNNLTVAEERESVQRQDKEEEEFRKLTGDLHHLLGTRSISGVFSSPYGFDYDITAFGKPMELHLQEAFAVKRMKDKAQERALIAARRAQEGKGNKRGGGQRVGTVEKLRAEVASASELEASYDATYGAAEHTAHIRTQVHMKTMQVQQRAM